MCLNQMNDAIQMKQKFGTGVFILIISKNPYFYTINNIILQLNHQY